jgi:hypothetical protein
MPPRVLGQIRQAPRVWARLVDAQSAIMPDAAWLLREVRQAGAFDGTPNFQETRYGGPGGYAAKLSTPTQAERQDPDKWSVDTSHTLAVMCDIEPVISDFVEVLSPTTLRSGTPERFRIVGDVLARRTAFGPAFLYHLGLQRLSED